MEKSRPYIILNAAISVDGKIASRSHDSKLSSKIDMIRVHRLRSKVDAILVGKNTVKRDNPLLTVRYTKGKNPIRIIIDSTGSLSMNSKIIKTSKTVPTIIATTSLISQHKKSQLKKKNIALIICGKKSINFNYLMNELRKIGIKKILVEGGGTTNWEFVSRKLFDEVILTVAPVILGGISAVSFISGKGFSKIVHSPQLKLQYVHRQGNEVILRYVKL